MYGFSDWNDLWRIVIWALLNLAGLVFGLLLAHFMVGWIVNALWRRLGVVGAGGRLHPGLLGVVERALYIAALLMGTGGGLFVALWLALKAAGQWKRWSADAAEDGSQGVSGREAFSIFLAGNGLSIIYAATGWLLMDWLPGGRWPESILAALAVLAGTALLRPLARARKPRPA